MIKHTVTVLLMIYLLTGASFAEDAGDVTFPGHLTVENVDLVLNGSGIRTKKLGFVTVKPYAAALFLKEKTDDGVAVVNADAPMAIRIYITTSLMNFQRISKAAREAFERSTSGNTRSIQKEIDEMIEAFKGDINTDDIYDFVYLPGVGTCIYKQGQKKTVVKGLGFKKALFSIWLGPRPVMDALKNRMLGRPVR